MRKAVLLSIFSVILLASKSDAQHFVTSFGVTHSWGMPYEVVHAIEHDYWGYDIVHTNRIVQHGKLFYDVVLQRGDVFVTVNIGARGRIYRRMVTYDYPFHNHVCNDFCGYHDVYYRNHRSVCNSHHHHGHNHVVYVRPSKFYQHNGYAYKKGYQHGYNKGKKNSHYGNSTDRSHRDSNSSKSRINSRDYHSRPSSTRVAEQRETKPKYDRRSRVSSTKSTTSRSSRASFSSSSRSISGRSSTGVSGRSTSATSGRSRAD